MAQYVQPHVLLAGGAEALDSLLPGFTAEVSRPLDRLLPLYTAFLREP